MSNNPSDRPIASEIFSEADRLLLEKVKERLASVQAEYDRLSRLKSLSERPVLSERRRKRRLSHSAACVREPLPIPQDYPRRASQMLPGRESLISLLWQEEEVLVPDAAILRRDYFDMKSIHGVAALHGLERRVALKALKDIGVDVYEEIAREWESGVTIRELSRRHGPSQTAISNWIKKAGRVILPRNANRKHDIELILQVYDETRSCKRAAQAGGVAWATAKNILEKHDRWIESCKRPKGN